ncbi:cyclic AMP-dependent transcription factor ATF-6 alpha-like [Hydractinia symbiolongicarpus]|uniref:cyclic AMP-dependent transcription factor ATF-6 alpha-like n=1 Tax=Hydractinia symbiolongicarpus TaxID=13093 RepID=UPI00254DC534|nr:cyclic AMP-dependent transcription factor ATF-6 alpha-like [Hydractinia symbiolongicarpus]
MISVSEMMAFSKSEKNFLEDNLLDANDWEKGDPYGFEDYNINPVTSLNPDQFDFGKKNTAPLQADDLDSWFQTELQNIITQDDITMKKCIKEEPLSPPPQTHENIILNEKINILTTNTQTANPTTKMTKIAPIASPILPTNSVHVKSVGVGINNKILINGKTNQPTSLVTQETKVLSSSNMIKLENGQYYVSTVPVKPPANLQGNVVVTGTKRPSNVKTETLLPQNLAELKTYKRQMRMMKNRESACLSRQRKKQHVTELESRVNQMAALNKKLREENEKLKERIQSLECENSSLRLVPEKTYLKQATKSTLLFAIVLLFIFNPFTAINDKNELPISSPNIMMPHHRSRSLLQFDNSNIKNFDYSFSKNNYNANKYYFNDVFNKKRKSKVYKIRQKSSKDFTLSRDLSRHVGFSDTDIDCGEQFNKTDLNRINQALQGLVKGLNKRRHVKRKTNNLFRPRNSLNMTDEKIKRKPSNCNGSYLPTPRPLLPTKNIRPAKYKKVMPANRYPVINNTSQQLVQAIQKSISRKADTFYVVSLLKDYIILPATNYNQTQRPKVSFILPAFHPHSNDSSINDANKQQMLLIDCNVIDTKLIRLDQSTLSKYSFMQVKS